MPNELFRYETPYGRPKSRTNYFGWTVAILLLTGFAFAAWLGSLYIFEQPERPESYRILKKLKRIDPPRRFELTAAPAGEFLDPKKLIARYGPMGVAELGKTNSELTRNYIRNYQQVRGLVPYVVGRFRIIDVRQLGPADIFTSGMVVLASAIDNGELLIEHIYPAEEQDVPKMKETLVPGLELTLARAHDISAVIHATRTSDGRILITTMPLLYGTYTVTRGTGTFTLEPPLDLNLAAGWPLIKPEELKAAENRYAEVKQENASSIPIPGMTPISTPAAQNQLVRVEQAEAVNTPPAIAAATPAPVPATTGKNKKGGKKQKPTPAPVIASAKSAAKPPMTTTSSGVALQPAQVALSAPPVEAPKAIPVPPASGGALASTAGGGSWKTFAPGKMPLGRLIATGDLGQIADRGLAGERIYLKGQFVVNFSDANKAVLRPRSRLPDSVMRIAGGSSTRVIVEYPAGYNPPPPGSTMNRDEARPLEITEVRKQEDGQLNVFAREIMQQ
ncbi:MAG: hypothetical protein M3R59_11650 [Verrucomicrobiota bacterium]|nr:hypothetical protein [Verrucomicrobiota bacterium]